MVPENEGLPFGLGFPFSNAIIRDSRDLTLHTVQTDVGLDCQPTKQSHFRFAKNNPGQPV
jgi:hypothetical protein